MSDKVNVAIAHDYLIQMGGAERVVLCLSKIFPAAPIFTSITNYNLLLLDFDPTLIVNSWMQCLPKGPIVFKLFFFLYPFAFLFRVLPRDVNTLIVSSSSFSKYISFSSSARNVLYCHNPTRFLYDPAYLRSEVSSPILRGLVRALLPPLRWLDKLSLTKYAIIIANSENVRRRILSTYGLQSLVIHPPVDISRFRVSSGDKGYFLILSRLIAYKRVDLAVQAFNQLGLVLHVVGSGSDHARLKAMAGPNIHFLGQLSESQIIDQYRFCRALIFPGYEDFGMTPVEAQASGKPVIAFGEGGALETIIDGETGLFFSSQTTESLISAIYRFNTFHWDPLRIRANAELFSADIFRQKLLDIIS